MAVWPIFHKVALNDSASRYGLASPAPAAAVFALPGNPVSTLVCLRRFVIPALFCREPGPVAGAPSGEDRSGRPGLRSPSRSTFYLPVQVELDDWGRPWAVPRLTNNSGDFTALAGTDGLRRTSARARIPTPKASSPACNHFAKGQLIWRLRSPHSADVVITFSLVVIP